MNETYPDWRRVSAIATRLFGDRYSTLEVSICNESLMKFEESQIFLKKLWDSSNFRILDIKFEESVKANYQESSLYANEANYSNSESYLSISGDVKIKDIRGEIFTDNLFFDLKNQTVDIKSSSENNVKANIKVNEKKF